MAASSVPRSWLQSPRKWAGRTPTHAQPGATTPNSMRLAAYYGTLQKPSKWGSRTPSLPPSLPGSSLLSLAAPD